MSTTHILVVDADSERARSVTQRARSDDWSFAVSTDASSARREIDSRPISLVLADASAWPALADWMMQAHPALPAVVLSSRQDEGPAVMEQLRLGAMSFVPRDADRRRLVETIRTILELNRRSPHRAAIRSMLRGGAVELQLTNDPALVPVVVGYFQRILEDYGLTGPRELMQIGVALTEALANSIIHGNLEVGSDLRAERSDVFYDLIDERRTMEPYRGRVVDVVMRISQSVASFVIRDQGKGFDRAALPDPLAPENLVKPSGRGILLMRTYSDTVSWNASGTEVTLTKVMKP